MEQLSRLIDYSNRTLEAALFQDYCPNGLQIAGREEIRTLITGVTACEKFLDSAIDANADAVLVHHGYFWKGETESIVGMKYRRIKRLMDSGIALLAYHLRGCCGRVN